MIADVMVYHNNEIIYDFNLSQNISGQELKKYAETSDLMIRLVDFKNISFGKNELVITFINPESNISLGKQPSVFPKNNIVYQVFHEQIDKKIKFFTIQSDDYEKIVGIKYLLEENGYNLTLDTTEPVKFCLDFFSPLNLKFFALLTLLLILSIATYYVYRLKEIGVLKLNGWSNRKISFQLLLGLLIPMYLFSLLFIIPFGIYVICMDISKIILYVQIYLLLCFFLALIFFLSAFVGTFFIGRINKVGAIKNNKNNKLIFYILITFKLVIVTLYILSLNNLFDNIYRLNANIKGIDKLQNLNFYRIQTSVVPDDSLHKKLNQLIDSLEDVHVYNYSSPTDLLDIKKLKSYKDSGKFREFDKRTDTCISPNILTLMDILDQNGNRIGISQVDSITTTLLVPIHFKDNIEMILKDFHLEEDTEIIYIQSGQVFEDILWPGYYVYDSIYYIQELKKALYLNSGDVLLDKESGEFIRQELSCLGIDTNSVRVESLKKEYNILKGNLQLNLYESFLYMIINSLSFFICIVSIITIFLTLRKKELGVYKLTGKYPIGVVCKFIAFNGIITLGIALIMNPIFLFLFFIEGVIYGAFKESINFCRKMKWYVLFWNNYRKLLKGGELE